MGHYLWLGVGDTEHMELHEHGQVTMATTAMHGMGNASVGPHNGGDHNDIMFASALLTWHLIAVVPLCPGGVGGGEQGVRMLETEAFQGREAGG